MAEENCGTWGKWLVNWVSIRKPTAKKAEERRGCKRKRCEESEAQAEDSAAQAEAKRFEAENVREPWLCPGLVPVPVPSPAPPLLARPFLFLRRS